MSRDGLHTTITNHKHHEVRYGKGSTDYATTQKKNSNVTRMNKGGNVSPEILEQYGIAKKDITNWSKVQVGVLNALHINEATLTRGEWS
ncbi:MAG TPA: hypothetical protein VGW78_06975, partial [Candidatus Babeliales bacterium]|nr:hypothetical protein [Candidatus Babeliales bacterium]